MVGRCAAQRRVCRLPPGVPPAAGGHPVEREVRAQRGRIASSSPASNVSTPQRVTTGGTKPARAGCRPVTGGPAIRPCGSGGQRNRRCAGGAGAAPRWAMPACWRMGLTAPLQAGSYRGWSSWSAPPAWSPMVATMSSSTSRPPGRRGPRLRSAPRSSVVCCGVGSGLSWAMAATVRRACRCLRYRRYALASCAR